MKVALLVLSLVDYLAAVLEILLVVMTVAY